MTGPLDFGPYGLTDSTIGLQRNFRTMRVMIDNGRFEDVKAALVQLERGCDEIMESMADAMWSNEPPDQYDEHDIIHADYNW